jgi:hypothetical protein
VDHEPAETHLRLLAERMLRASTRATGSPRPSAVITVNLVARSLVTIGALDAAVGAAVVDELALALESRQTDPPTRHPGARSVSWWPAAVAPGTQQAPSARRFVAAGLTMPMRDGSMHVLSYARSGAGAAFVVVAHSPVMDSLDEFTATDDTGTSYQLMFSGSSSSEEWNGELALYPDPPPGLRWLELTGPGRPAQRISLYPEPEPDRAVSSVPASPGEYLLNVSAAGLLATLPYFAPRERRPLAAVHQDPSERAGLAEIMKALVAIGALPPDSPMPGQLAALREAVSADDPDPDPDPAAASGAELPEHWASVLASYQRPGQAAAQPDSCAPMALTLPELDGVVVSVLGLHSADRTCTLSIHASGIPPWPMRGAEPLPLIWLRDSDECWHVTRPGGSTVDDGELLMQLVVMPPLARPDWVEVVVMGRSAQVRATVPLRWG